MKKKSKTAEVSTSTPWQKIPKYLLPFVIVFIVAIVFFVAQYAASLLVSIYPFAAGYNAAQASTWLDNSITAQFIYILLAETFTVGLIYLLLRHYKRDLRTIGLNSPKWKYLIFAIIGYPVYLIGYLVLFNIFSHVFPALNANQVQQIGFNSVHGPYQLILTFISLVILPPIAEEILFRGFMFEGLKKSMSPIFAGLITSAIFASAHLPEGASHLLWIGALDTFTLSLVLVYLKQKTKSLWPGIILHALKNLVAFITLFLLTTR